MTSRSRSPAILFPEKVAKRSEFPISTGGPMLKDKQQRKIGGIDPTAQAIIESLQPTVRGNDLPFPPSGLNSLALLHDLENIDKHRTLHTTLFAEQGFAFGGANAHLVRAHNRGGPIEDGAELFRYALIGPDPHRNVSMNFDLSLRPMLRTRAARVSAAGPAGASRSDQICRDGRDPSARRLPPLTRELVRSPS